MAGEFQEAVGFHGKQMWFEVCRGNERLGAQSWGQATCTAVLSQPASGALCNRAGGQRGLRCPGAALGAFSDGPRWGGQLLTPEMALMCVEKHASFGDLLRSMLP